MDRVLPSVAAAASGILVGLAMVATRFVIDQTEPASLALLRYAIASLCLLPAVPMSARVRLARRDVVPIALLGINLPRRPHRALELRPSVYRFGPRRRDLRHLAAVDHGLRRGAALRFETLTPFKSAGVILTIFGIDLELSGKLSFQGTVAGA